MVETEEDGSCPKPRVSALCSRVLQPRMSLAHVTGDSCLAISPVQYTTASTDSGVL